MVTSAYDLFATCIVFFLWGDGGSFTIRLPYIYFLFPVFGKKAKGF
jgi:hypothetical protein